MAHARLYKQLTSRAESQSRSECAMSCAAGTVLCPLPPLKARHHTCGQEDAQGVHFGSVHGISMAQASLGVLPPAFPLARICLISPSPLPAAACFQHGLTLQALLSTQPNQPTSMPSQNLWSSWIQVSDPSLLDKLSLATSTCSHAPVVPPSLHWRMWAGHWAHSSGAQAAVLGKKAEQGPAACLGWAPGSLLAVLGWERAQHPQGTAVLSSCNLCWQHSCLHRVCLTIPQAYLWQGK